MLETPRGCGLELRFDLRTQAWSNDDHSQQQGAGSSTLFRKLSRFVPRRTSTRTSLLALAQNVDALCVLLPDGREPAESMGALIKVQVYGVASPSTNIVAASVIPESDHGMISSVPNTSSTADVSSDHGISSGPNTSSTAADVSSDCINFCIEAIVRGEQVPVSLASSSSLASRQPVPTLSLNLPTPPGQTSNGGGGMLSPRFKALGSPLVMSLDLQGCQGPGQICINVWSGGLLLASNKGLVLPAACEAVASEIARHSRSWSKAMLGDLAALIECTDVARRRGGMMVSDHRRQSQATIGSQRGVRLPALVPVDREYVGTLVWGGQNIMCKAEEGGWRATAKLLDDMIKKLESLLEKLQKADEAAGPSIVGPLIPAPGEVRKTARFSMDSPHPPSFELYFSSHIRGRRRASMDMNTSGTPGINPQRLRTASDSGAPEAANAWKPESKGVKPAARGMRVGPGSDLEPIRSDERFPMLEFSAAFMLLAMFSAAHGQLVLGQGTQGLMAHAIIAGPYAALLLSVLLMLPSARLRCSPSSRIWRERLSTTAHFTAILSLRAALALMAQGIIAVPFVFSEAVRTALDWPAHVLLVYLEGPWSLLGIVVRFLVDVHLQYNLLGHLGMDHAVLRAVACQLLAVVVYWIAFRGLIRVSRGEQM